MTRASGTSVENSFTKGFVTEFSGFNFPENACEETLNSVFNSNGVVSRRLGLALDPTASFPSITYNTASIYTSFVWKAAGLESENTFLVQQIDNTLHFYQLNSEDIPSNKKSFTFDLSTYATTGNPGLYRCDYANGSGRLFVANKASEPFYIKYNGTTDNIETRSIPIEIRDFKVLDDGIPIIENLPYTDTTNKKYVYNIMNQGWTTNLISAWNTQGNNERPNKAQVWWYFRDAAATASVPGYLQFAPNYRYKFQDLGTTVAPRGYFVLNAFDQDRNAVSGLTGLDTVSSNGQRPSCVSFINGRVFYSGVEADSFNGVVYFSDIIKDTDSDIRFYQKGDPTSEVNPQLLPNDGGTFIIPEAGKILRMVPVKNTLVFFASNGVWTVQGSSEVGFSATDFSVEKISDVPCVDNESFTTIGNFPLWWTNEGIFTLQSSNIGAVSTQNITRDTIHTFFNEIPVASKAKVRGDYNTLTNEIFWIYSTDKLNPSAFDRVLVFNTRTQAFYLYSLPDNIKVIDVVATPIIEFSNYNPDALHNAKFVVEHSTNKIGFARFSNVNLLDWEDLVPGGVPYDSYFVTGPRVRGEGQRKFQENYVTVYTKYVADGSCWVFSIWDYGNVIDSNRWGTPQQATKPNDKFDYSSRRLKIRGNGKSVKFKFQSEENKPFNILGWAAYETVNDKV